MSSLVASSSMALLQIRGAVPTSPIELVTHATPLTQVVLVVLVVLSLLSWGIMIAKWVEFRRADSAARRFMHDFERTTRLEQARALVQRSASSPFTRVFARGTDFLMETRTGLPARGPGEPIAAAASPLSGTQVEAFRLVLDAEAIAERERLGRYIPALAVIGSASPLIGLLGTVLGVIDAFLGIAASGSGNLGAVAPGVAEALIATAVALAVAIPATFGYNLFAARLNRIDNELDAFGTEIIAMLVREGHI
jgi:biopolymer transport protein TolQ